jgi:hypothetical protein
MVSWRRHCKLCRRALSYSTFQHRRLRARITSLNYFLLLLSIGAKQHAIAGIIITSWLPQGETYPRCSAY